MSKKVCILSMQHVQNFGSLLQSYALKKMLEKLGAEVSFINIKRKEEDDILVKDDRLQFKNEMEKTSEVFKKLKKIDRYFFNRLRIRLVANKQDDIFQNFRVNQLGITGNDDYRKYDLCVIGSDEVFNCMIPSAWGFTSQLFGNVDQADSVITYAASCGATTFDKLNSAMISTIKNSFKRVSGFSARDKNTKDFIENITSEVVESHYDPVWVGDFSEELRQTKVTVKLPKKYCIIYSYYNRIHDKKEIEDILKFCKEKNLEPIALGAPQMWIKNYLAVSPFEMLKIFQMADFIITDTFHGTIFAEKFNGHFAVLYRESNKNKLSDLVKKIGAENHVVENFSNLYRVFDEYNSREDILSKIQAEREISINYLKKYIKY